LGKERPRESRSRAAHNSMPSTATMRLVRQTSAE
jgi:hypothetical protein